MKPTPLFFPTVLVLFVLCLFGTAHAQRVQPIQKKPKPVIEEVEHDSNWYRIAPEDSVRMMDSIYAVRRQQINERERLIKERGPQDDFISIWALVSTYGRLKSPDLSEYFAIRAGRPDPASERPNTPGIDRCFLGGIEADLARSWGIFVRYGLEQRFFNTLVENSTDPNVPNTEQSIDLTIHSIVTGPSVMLYSSHFFKARAMGGIGGAFVSTHEEEKISNAKRDASATGVAVAFDLAGDFRFSDWSSFTLDLYSQSISTSTLKTASGDQLSKPFGKRTTAMPISPRASNISFGLALGLTFYLW